MIVKQFGWISVRLGLRLSGFRYVISRCLPIFARRRRPRQWVRRISWVMNSSASRVLPTLVVPSTSVWPTRSPSCRPTSCSRGSMPWSRGKPPTGGSGRAHLHSLASASAVGAANILGDEQFRESRLTHPRGAKHQGVADALAQLQSHVLLSRFDAVEPRQTAHGWQRPIWYLS